MKNCIRCKHAEIKFGICCPRCNAVLNVMALVTRHWEVHELEDLRDTLRDGNTKTMFDEAKNRGASVMAKLLWHIRAGAKGIHMDPEVLKSKVCDALNEEVAGQQAIVKHDSEHGEGTYMARAAKWLAEVVSGLLGRKSEAPARKEAA